jgi:hypothetical protein
VYGLPSVTRHIVVLGSVNAIGPLSIDMYLPAFPEIARTLKPGGRFGASEPWRAPLYSVGTRVLGKREESVFCRPLTTERVAPLESSFSSSEVRQFGAITRYPVLALTKFGVHLPLKVVWWLYRLDDRLAAMVPPLNRYGSGVALLATK